MRTFIALTIIALTTAGCATSTEPRPITSTHTSTASRPSRNSGAATTSTGEETGKTGPPTGSTAAAFCHQVQQVGLRNLDATDASRGQNLAAQLAGIDRLAGIAPEAVRADFVMFDKFEHAVVDEAAGRRADMANLNTPRLSTALRRVGSYLVDTCHISQ